MSEPEPTYSKITEAARVATYNATVPGLHVQPEQINVSYRRLLEVEHRALMMKLHEVRRQLGLPKLNERKR